MCGCARGRRPWPCVDPRSSCSAPCQTCTPRPCTPGLEEAVEHLILDQLDVGQYGPSLLDPEFELDHVFD